MFHKAVRVIFLNANMSFLWLMPSNGLLALVYLPITFKKHNLFSPLAVSFPSDWFKHHFSRKVFLHLTTHLTRLQFNSVAQSCPTLCNPMDYSTPGLFVHNQHSELAQTQVHQVSDAIQPSHPLSSPSPPAFNLQSFQWIFRTDFL